MLSNTTKSSCCRIVKTFEFRKVGATERRNTRVCYFHKTGEFVRTLLSLFIHENQVKTKYNIDILK